MPGDSRTTAQRNRQARQDALREYMAEQKHEQHAIVAIENMVKATEPFELSKWEKVYAARMRLVDKYLPTPKEVAMDAVVDAVMEITAVERHVIDPANPNS